ncbi:unnamed protein product [Somion occarium]|uniref:RING-type domain-containing protein n=1 Tax=Somion occarium TaxID=3059160 RepID=A0ABP1E8R1_9APHY
MTTGNTSFELSTTGFALPPSPRDEVSGSTSQEVDSDWAGTLLEPAAEDLTTDVSASETQMSQSGASHEDDTNAHSAIRSNHENESLQISHGPKRSKRLRLNDSVDAEQHPATGPSQLHVGPDAPRKRMKIEEQGHEADNSLYDFHAASASSSGIEPGLLTSSQPINSTRSESDPGTSLEGSMVVPESGDPADSASHSHPSPSTAVTPDREPTHTDAKSEGNSSTKVPAEPLSNYTCPICFSPPTYATMTPCGHVCCGECLFTAVKTAMQRAAYHGPAAERAKCPVCRAPIPGWDGRGGGVIGLQPRVMYKVESPRKAR